MQDNGQRQDSQAQQPAPDRPGGAQDDGGWADIGRRIEEQLRRDVARVVGADQADDWNAIKETLVSRVRGQASGVEREAVVQRVREVGQEAEEAVRSGLANATRAGRDADWPAIARTLRERVEHILDPARPPYPGGSGTGESEEDRQVPAAQPSPDQPPVSAQRGGEDTGLPTVTQDVDAEPKRPPTEPGGTSTTPRPSV